MPHISSAALNIQLVLEDLFLGIGITDENNAALKTQIGITSETAHVKKRRRSESTVFQKYKSPNFTIA
jgi:hypothetical protein